MTSKVLLVMTMLALAVAACSDAGPANSPISSTVPTSSAVAAATGPAAALNEARSLWETSAIGSYEFVYVYQCECDPGWAGPWRIKVENGVAVSRVHEADLPDFGDPPTHTVDDLFDIVENGIADFPDSNTIEYDDTFGYPKSIALDLDAIASDGGTSIAVWEFSPGP